MTEARKNRIQMMARYLTGLTNEMVENLLRWSAPGSGIRVACGKDWNVYTANDALGRMA